MQTLKQHKHDSGSFFQTLWGFCLVVMVVLGIGGTIYKLLSPSGWIAGLLGRGFSGGVAAVGLMIVFGVIGWVARNWTTTREQAATATFVVYVFAAAGLLYSFQLWSKGSF
jgi:hypothetical protein